jgi:aryl-alcohol dehydrogenase-like predicted oxidoreductase
MQKRTLGNNHLEVSALGLGWWHSMAMPVIFH